MIKNANVGKNKINERYLLRNFQSVYNFYHFVISLTFFFSESSFLDEKVINRENYFIHLHWYTIYFIHMYIIWIWSYDSWYILLFCCWCNCFKFPLKTYAIKICMRFLYFSHSLVSQDWFHSWVFRCFYQNMKNSIQRILK